MTRRNGPARGRNPRRGRRCPCWRPGSGRSPHRAGRVASRGAAASMPSLLKPKRLITARSSVRRNSRGRRVAGLRARGGGADLDESRSLRATAVTGPVAFLSNPAASPIGLGSVQACHGALQPGRGDQAGQGRHAQAQRRQRQTVCGFGIEPVQRGQGPGAPAGLMPSLPGTGGRRSPGQRFSPMHVRQAPDRGRDAGIRRHRATIPISGPSPSASVSTASKDQALVARRNAWRRSRRPVRRSRNGYSHRPDRPARRRFCRCVRRSAHSGGAEYLVNQHGRRDASPCAERSSAKALTSSGTTRARLWSSRQMHYLEGRIVSMIKRL